MENYTIVEQIGKGSFGRVLLVEEAGSGARSVIKQVNTTNMTQTEQQKASFMYVIGLIDIRYRFCLSLSTIMDTSKHLFVSTGPSRSGIAV